MGELGVERQVVILMTDMVHYANISGQMSPTEICAFLTMYHTNIRRILSEEKFQPVEVEATGGDGSIILFEREEGDDLSVICTKALLAAMRLAEAISHGDLVPTRMGLMLGSLVESDLCGKIIKCGSCFAVANRLEELSGYFGVSFLMDREIARYQQGFDDFVVNVAKVSLTSVPHPLNLFTVYTPGSLMIPDDVDIEKLKTFIHKKNEAMEFFCGNQLEGILPDFPRVREELLETQAMFRELTGNVDMGTARILEYIREMPRPAMSFKRRGMELMEKKRDSLGERLFHLSKELLRAMDPEFYAVLVEDTEWEQFFKLEWFSKGDVIIEIDSEPDGIYYIDYGQTITLDEEGNQLSVMESGSIFGEMAYFGAEKRRTATVVANTDVVVRRIATEDFEKLPTIIRIFERIAQTRMLKIQQREQQQHC